MLINELQSHYAQFSLTTMTRGTNIMGKNILPEILFKIYNADQSILEDKIIIQ